MKKKPVIAAALFLIASTATACAANDNSDQEWFAENCATQTADIRESIVQGKPGGAVVGTAIVQGPIKPPSGLDESTQKIGLYTYDKASAQMIQEGEIKSADPYCLEPITDKNADLRMSLPQSQVEGDLQKDQNEADFTMLRSPKYPEGIWVGLHISNLPKGFSVDDKLEDQCPLSWWPSTDISPVGDAIKIDSEVAKYALTTASDC